MKQLLCLIPGLGGDVYAQLSKKIFVHMGQDNGGVGLAALEIIQLLYGAAGHGIGDGADGQGNK